MIKVKRFKKSILDKTVSKEKKPIREESAWKSHREYEKQVKETVSDMLLKLFLEIRRKWLKLPGEFKKSESNLFKLNGKIYINPKTGKPLTNKQWKEVVKGLDSAFIRIFRNQPEMLAKKAMLLGKVLQGMSYEQRKQEELGNIIIPDRIPKDTSFQDSLSFAEQNSAEYITDLTSQGRKDIATTINNSMKLRESPKQLESRLFDKFATLNKDWQRIAETEIASNVNNGMLLSELQDREGDEPIYMIGVSAPNACKYCQKLISGKIVVLVDEPDKGYTKIDGNKYPTIWAGKSNYGNSAKEYVPTTPLHVRCRCSWTRYYPEMKELLGKSRGLPIGTIRLWKGVRYKKTGNRKWISEIDNSNIFLKSFLK